MTAKLTATFRYLGNTQLIRSAHLAKGNMHLTCLTTLPSPWQHPLVTLDTPLATPGNLVTLASPLAMSKPMLDTLLEAKVLIERWRVHYNTVRPHSSLGYQPPGSRGDSALAAGLRG